MAFDAKAFMDGFTDRFSKEVDSHAIVKTLEMKKVIPCSTLHKIEHTDTKSGTLILYMHVRDNADLEALHKLCDVMIDSDGHQQTSQLGRDMKKKLPPLPGQAIQPSPPENQDSLNTSPPSETSDVDTFLNIDAPKSNVPRDVRYVFMTANKNELKSAQHFLGINCKVSDKVKSQTFKGDEDLESKVQGIDPDIKLKDTAYKFFTVANKNAVLMKCSGMGSVASQQATIELLAIAQERGWSVEAIFIVGCCAAISEKNEGSETGSVFVADRIYYHGSGKLEDGTHKSKLDGYRASTVHCDDLEGLGSPTIQSIKIVSMLSGDLLVKDKAAAEDRRKRIGEKRVGFEMEGFGVVTAVNLHQLQQKSHKMPKVVLLKGVSDDASPDKNKSASIMFFSEKMDDVDEDTRQQMCTIMSLTVALRAICNEYV